MTAPHPELVTAARTLLQWAQARQTVWRDPSTEIIAALGNRYQAFMDEGHSEPGPVPPPPSPPAPLPPSAAFVASAPSGPVATHPTPPAPTPIIPLEPVVQSRPSIIPPKPPAPRQMWRPMPSETRRSDFRRPAPQPAARSKIGWMWVAMAAVAIVVAVVAAPRFKDREPSRTAVTTQTGTLTLESTPPGSTVLVDGAERGTTPLTIEVAPGTHSVQFRYRKNVRSVGVAVTAGEPTTQSVDWTRKPRPRPEAKEPTPAAAAPLDEPKAEEPAAADAPQPPLGN